MIKALPVILLCTYFFGISSLRSQRQPLVIPPAPDLALTHVTLIDGTGSAATSNQTLLLQEGKIIDIFEEGEKEIPPNFSVMDLEGHYVIPGLIDSHVHMGMRNIFQSPELPRQEFRRWLYSGVTTVRDMGGDARLLAAENRLIHLERIPGPDIYYVATMGGRDFMEHDPRMTISTIGIGPGEASWSQLVDASTDAEEAISRARGAHVAGIKFYIGVEQDVIRRLTSEAHRQGLKSWAHLTVYPDRPLDVINAGVDVVSHMWGAAWQDPDADPSIKIPFTHTPPQEARAAIYPPDFALIETDSPEMNELITRMKESGVIWDMTYSLTQLKDDDYAAFSKSIARKAAEAGVIICTGTDFYNSIEEPYPALFQEIYALVNDGILSPAEAITAATMNGARAIGIEETHGSAEPGKAANLIVLRANPLENIQAIQEIEFVLKDGKPYYRSEFSK